ncbi:MAG: class I SAM-dependent methyltransferase [Pseudomonadota bacterium]
MQDSWKSGDRYEQFMGRWSTLTAQQFLDWLAPQPGLDWLDVGCGSGALSEVALQHHTPATITAIDQSDDFVTTAQQRLGDTADCRVGNALDLPLEEASADVAVSGLVLNFIPEPGKALTEMKRVTRSGGVIAAYVWDYAGSMEMLNYFWDAVVQLDPEASPLHEAGRFPDCNPDALQQLFNRAGLAKTTTAPLEVATHFSSFDDYWTPFLGGQGPAPTYVQSLEKSAQQQLRDLLQQRLPIRDDGSIPLSAIAWAVSGEVPA